MRTNSTFSRCAQAIKFMALALLFVNLVAQAQVITSISPDVGKEGDLFTIEGSGFDNLAANHSVLIKDGTRSVLAEVLFASPTELICRLSVVAEAMTGDVEVRIGARLFLPSFTLTSTTDIYLVDGLTWFETTSGTQSPSYNADTESVNTLAAGREGDSLVFDLDPLAVDAPKTALVRIDIETGMGEGSDEGTTVDAIFRKSSSGAPAIEARLRMTRTTSQTQLTAEQLAIDIARALRQSFKAQGLSARAEGRKIRVKHLDWDLTTETYGQLQLILESSPTQANTGSR